MSALDQAQGLRNIFSPPRELVVGVAGGPQVGKTALARSLALTFTDLETPGSSLGSALQLAFVDAPALSVEHPLTRRCQALVVLASGRNDDTLTRAYAAIKWFNLNLNLKQFCFVATWADLVQGRQMFGQLATLTDRFLQIELDYGGVIEHFGESQGRGPYVNLVPRYLVQWMLNWHQKMLHSQGPASEQGGTNPWLRSA